MGLINLVGEINFIICGFIILFLFIREFYVKKAVDIRVFRIILFYYIELAQIVINNENLLFIFLYEDYFIIMLLNSTYPFD